jgi:hypothetical protein
VQPFIVLEPFGFVNLAVLGFQLLQWPGIQRSHGAASDTDGLFALFPSVQTQVAFLHLGVIFGAELGRLVGTGFEAELTCVLPQTNVPINYDYAILMTFSYCVHRTGWHTGRFSAVVAVSAKKGHKRVGICASLYSLDPHPASWACGDIMPVLAGHHAGKTAGASGLIEKES